MKYTVTPAQALRWLMAQGDMQPDAPCPPDASDAAIRAIGQPITYCPVCWHIQFPDGPDFPSGFSSATCPGHYAPRA